MTEQVKSGQISQPALTRCVTIDVEEYYHIEAAHGRVDSAQWWDWPSRISLQIDKLLELFGTLDIRATFFVLGDVARRTPQVVQLIANAGHEIASHGCNHARLHRMTPKSLASDLTDSRAILQDLTGQPVEGYRAPCYSLTPDTRWAIDTIIDAGFSYDASIFPIRRQGYGMPDAPITPHALSAPSGRSIATYPALVWETLVGTLPAAGGGYFRLLPSAIMKAAMRQAQDQQRPAVLYFHPWEFDADWPRLPLTLKNRIRTYTGLQSALPRLRKLLEIPARDVPLQELHGQFSAQCRAA